MHTESERLLFFSSGEVKKGTNKESEILRERKEKPLMVFVFY